MTPFIQNHTPDAVAIKVKAAYPRAESLGYDIPELAALADLPLAVVQEHLTGDGVLAELNAAKIRADADGSLLEPVALVLVGKVLDRIAAQVDSMDAFEAAEVSKPLLRILEAADRRRANEHVDEKKLPTFNIFIDLSGRSKSGSTKSIDAGDVHDVDAKHIDDGEGSSWV